MFKWGKTGAGYLAHNSFVVIIGSNSLSFWSRVEKRAPLGAFFLA